MHKSKLIIEFLTCKTKIKKQGDLNFNKTLKFKVALRRIFAPLKSK